MRCWPSSRSTCRARQLRTRAVWLTLDDRAIERAEVDDVELPGALHAAEHAAIGILPLLATCDRWDLGGLSTALHPDTGAATIFVYDGHPGGAGFSERGFAVLRRWLQATRATVASCECESGCPSCVQSPKCGNGNDPLDKAGAVRVLDVVLDELAAAEGPLEDEELAENIARDIAHEMAAHPRAAGRRDEGEPAATCGTPARPGTARAAAEPSTGAGPARARAVADRRPTARVRTATLTVTSTTAPAPTAQLVTAAALAAATSTAASQAAGSPTTARPAAASAARSAAADARWRATTAAPTNTVAAPDQRRAHRLRASTHTVADPRSPVGRPLIRRPAARPARAGPPRRRRPRCAAGPARAEPRRR